MADFQGSVILAESCCWNSKVLSQGKPRFILKNTTFIHNATNFQASNAAMMAEMLPLLPPVVIGMYVLFAAFWPQRILFFSSNQRRKTMNDQFYTWLLSLFLLALAITINTFIVDEIVRLLDENIPLARIQLDRNLGWNLNMAASAFCLLSGNYSLQMHLPCERLSISSSPTFSQVCHSPSARSS